MLWQDVQRPVYQDFELLGSGATGEVYKARRLSDGLTVAKSIHASLTLARCMTFKGKRGTNNASTARLSLT